MAMNFEATAILLTARVNSRLLAMNLDLDRAVMARLCDKGYQKDFNTFSLI